MVDLPTGTVTFLFTDIEGSTKLWERDAEAMKAALVRHDEILREAIEDKGGFVFKTVGDAFCCAFPTAPDAIKAALSAQRSLCTEEWNDGCTIRARMALHTGTVEVRGGDYYGPPVNRVARLLSAGHGGQTLLSHAIQELVRDELPSWTNLRDLGEKRLKDLFRPERVFQLIAPDLPAEFPPLKTLEGHRNNLPTQPTPLVGREREVAEVREMVHRTETRLLTLTGPGGTGKTRLALQAAANVLDDFPDGAFFVPLATLTDPELFTPTVARTLGVRETGEGTLEEALKSYLRERQLLLVLDNFEQVLEAAPAIGGLLEAAGVKVLATSRTPLGLYGEREYAVWPLSVPDVRHLPPVEKLSQYEAVRLFIERARAAKVEFEVTNENAPAVAEICARLDGLPLAIELAAARIKLLPPQAMLKRLSNRLQLLTGGARDLPERQRTLRGTIEWSYETLDEGEKMLFGRLAVFSGGRTLEAIEAVCDAEGDLPIDALEGVSSLLDKSVLRQKEGPEGEPRFVILETIHEFAREKLGQSGEAEEVRRLHAEYFLALAEEAEKRSRGAEVMEWLERLEAEHDNLRAALSWALERGDVELGLHLAGALGWFWEAHGHYSEGRMWLEEALAQDDRESMTARVKALDRLSVLVSDQDLDRAEALAQEGLKLSEQAGLGGAVAAEFLHELGWIAMIRGDYAQMKEVFEESLGLSRDADDKWGIADALLGLASAFDSSDDRVRAKELFEEGIALCRQLGYVRTLARHLLSLGYTLLLEGDYERGAALNEEAAALFSEHGYKGGSLELVLDNLGWAALLQGDHERASSYYRESLIRCKELGDKIIAAESLEGLACICAAEGTSERAALLFGAAETLREAVSSQHSPEEDALREPYVAAARSRLGEEGWEAALAKGRAMTFEEAIAYALEEEHRA